MSDNAQSPESTHVVVGMSGGVDSSVAAYLLKQHGYKITALFMKNWEEDDDDENCAAHEDLADAKKVCDALDIELLTVNFSHEYWERVFKNFLEEHKRGRTPNPDVLCNKEIKFKEFLEHAEALGAQFIATGHYVRTEKRNNEVCLLKGSDTNKDQSYFLYQLEHKALRKSLFPLGRLTKQEVRSLAENVGLPNFDKKDSTGICFIGEQKFKEFLQRFLPPQKGKIRAADGQIIGQHDGLMYYTIGQRQGLGIGGEGDAWYVIGKNMRSNTLIAAQGHDHPLLMSQVVEIESPYWLAGLPPALPQYCRAKTRYRQPDQPCVISRVSSNGATIEFVEPQRAVTPGQSLVLYQGSECMGGGIIRNAPDNLMLDAAYKASIGQVVA